MCLDKEKATNILSAQESVHELVLQQCTYDIVLVCVFDGDFMPAKVKDLILLTTGSTCLIFVLTYFFSMFC